MVLHVPRLSLMSSPHQLGFGVRGGCEAILHSVSILFKSPCPPAERMVLQVDMENAFNVMSRSLALNEARQHLPSVSAWAELTYGIPSNLYHDGSIIKSHTGFHQGDPLAGLLYCPGLQPTVRDISKLSPTYRLNCWFFDDGTISGSKSDLQKAADYLLREGPAKGIILNRAKSTVWCGPSHAPSDDPINRLVPRSKDEGIFLLGAPVGNTPFMLSSVEARIISIASTLTSLTKLEDPQIQFCLLRSCLSLPKFMYILRTCEPSVMLPAYQHFDQVQISALADILGTHIDPTTWQQASFSVPLGGMGLRDAAPPMPQLPTSLPSAKPSSWLTASSATPHSIGPSISPFGCSVLPLTSHTLVLTTLLPKPPPKNA
jgi:hypothetical protein